MLSSNDISTKEENPDKCITNKECMPILKLNNTMAAAHATQKKKCTFKKELQGTINTNNQHRN